MASHCPVSNLESKEIAVSPYRASHRPSFTSRPPHFSFPLNLAFLSRSQGHLQVIFQRLHLHRPAPLATPLSSKPSP